MTEEENEKENEISARIGGGPKISTIWLVPVVAALIGAWMVYNHWVGQGPIIEIRFQTASGIEAGKTKVKMKNVEIGEVLEISEGSAKVRLHRARKAAKEVLERHCEFEHDERNVFVCQPKEARRQD